MPVIEESVEIRREPAEVFDFLIVAENIPVWDSSVVEAKQESEGPPGVGIRVRGTSKVLGRRIKWVTEGTKFDPPSVMGNTTVEGPFKATTTISLRPIDGGTRLEYRLDAESGLGGVFGKLAEAFIVRAHGRTMRANLETLAELLEHHPPT